MQFKDQVSLFPISDRYELYCIAKRHLRGTPRPKVFPIEGSSKKTLEQRGGIPQQIASTVFSSQHKIARGMDMIKIAEATKKGYAEAKVGDSINLSVPNSKTRRGRVGKGIAQTLDTGMQQYTIQPTIIAEERTDEGLRFFKDNICGTIRTVKDGGDKRVISGARIRRLTPLEAERLQGFPDGWTSKGINEKGEEVNMSDTQRYKTCGNAVTVNVIKAIVERIMSNLIKEQ